MRIKCETLRATKPSETTLSSAVKIRNGNVLLKTHRFQLMVSRKSNCSRLNQIPCVLSRSPKYNTLFSKLTIGYKKEWLGSKFLIRKPTKAHEDISDCLQRKSGLCCVQKPSCFLSENRKWTSRDKENHTMWKFCRLVK